MAYIERGQVIQPVGADAGAWVPVVKRRLDAIGGLPEENNDLVKWEITPEANIVRYLRDDEADYSAIGPKLCLCSVPKSAAGLDPDSVAYLHKLAPLNRKLGMELYTSNNYQESTDEYYTRVSEWSYVDRNYKRIYNDYTNARGVSSNVTLTKTPGGLNYTWSFINFINLTTLHGSSEKARFRFVQYPPSNDKSLAVAMANMRGDVFVYAVTGFSGLSKRPGVFIIDKNMLPNDQASWLPTLQAYRDNTLNSRLVMEADEWVTYPFETSANRVKTLDDVANPTLCICYTGTLTSSNPMFIATDFWNTACAIPSWGGVHKKAYVHGHMPDPIYSIYGQDNGLRYPSTMEEAMQVAAQTQAQMDAIYNAAVDQNKQLYANMQNQISEGLNE